MLVVNSARVPFGIRARSSGWISGRATFTGGTHRMVRAKLDTWESRSVAPFLQQTVDGLLPKETLSADLTGRPEIWIHFSLLKEVVQRIVSMTASVIHPAVGGLGP